MSNNNKRGRPPGPLALAMDATACGLDNLEWDSQESALLNRIARYLRTIIGLSPQERVDGQAGDALAALTAWRSGDTQENQRHERQIGYLRQANHLLDAPEPPSQKEGCPMVQASDSHTKAGEAGFDL